MLKIKDLKIGFHLLIFVNKRIKTTKKIYKTHFKTLNKINIQEWVTVTMGATPI